MDGLREGRHGCTWGGGDSRWAAKQTAAEARMLRGPESVWTGRRLRVLQQADGNNQQRKEYSAAAYYYKRKLASSNTTPPS